MTNQQLRIADHQLATPVTVTLPALQLNAVRSAVRKIKKKLEHEYAKSKFVPEPGKRHATHEELKALTTAYEEILAAFKGAGIIGF